MSSFRALESSVFLEDPVGCLRRFWDEKKRDEDAAQQRMPIEEVNAFMGAPEMQLGPAVWFARR